MTRRNTNESAPARLSPPPTRAVAAADEIRRRVLDGTYPAGMQLRQIPLANEFGISVIPVREALVQLEAEGLLKINAHKGATVVALSDADVQELFELRMLLEPVLLKHSAPRLDAEDFARLDAITEEFSGALRTNAVSRWGDINTAFHIQLYARAERPRMQSTVRHLLATTDRFTRMHIAYADARELAEDEHRRIVALCKAGAFDDAAALLHLHILEAAEAMRAILANLSPTVDQ